MDWRTYYAAFLRTDSAHALVQHNGPLVGDTKRQAELIQGIAGGRSASLVWAPPGCGKSRFAIELAQKLEKERWETFFVRHDDAVVREELSEVTRSKRVVFIVDDAHTCPDLIAILTAACAAPPDESTFHLVCLARSSGRAAVSEALQSAFPAGKVQEMDLGKPSAALVRGLIDKLLPKSSPHHRDTIGRFVRQSFFLAVLVCNLVSRDRKLPQTFQRQDLRDRVCRDSLKEMVEGLGTPEAAARALSVYAALSPVARAREDVRQLSAELSGLTPEKQETLIQRAISAGLLAESGAGLLQPVPDLLGDLILEEVCLDGQGKTTPFSRKLLVRLFEIDPIATIGNCVDIGQLFGAAPDLDLVSEWVLNEARTVAPDNRQELVKVLNACRSLAGLRPATILEMANILEKRGILRRRPPADSIDIDVFGLLMRAAEVDTNIVPVALQLGRDLYSAVRGDDASTERVFTILRRGCGFEATRPAAYTRAVANALRAWVTEADIAGATLAPLLSAQFLTLSSKPAPEVAEVRDVAVETIVQAITRADSTVQTAGLTALEHFASSETRETDRLIEAIGKVSTATQSLPVWAAAEHIGWRWWVQDSAGLHGAGKKILAAAPSADTYQLWKALHSQMLPIVTRLPEPELASAQARSDFFSALAQAESAGRAIQLFESIESRQSDVEAWRALWRTAMDQTPAMPMHQQVGAVIGEFVRRHSDMAWGFVTEADAEGLFFPLLPPLLDELGKHDRARRSDEAGRVRSGTRLEEIWLQALGTSTNLNAGERGLLARALRSSELTTVHYAARVLLNSIESQPAEVFEAVFTAIRRDPKDELLWELVLGRFADWGSAQAADDAGLAQVASDLITLMQTQSSNLRWGFQPYTRQLDRVFATLAVASPARLQEWMERFWGRPRAQGKAWNDESPLDVRRFTSAMRSIRESAVAPQWIEALAAWIRRGGALGDIAARGISELCTLGDPQLVTLAGEIAANPTEAALKSFLEFVGHQSSKSSFASQALTLLEMWAQHPSAYARVEDAVVGAVVHQVGGRSVAQTRALEAVESAQANASSASPRFASSLDRLEREIREMM